MAGVLTDTQLSMLSGDFDTVFNTLSNGRTVVVVKDPIQTPISNPVTSNNLFGFGSQQTNPIFNLTPVTGVFPAMIMYGTFHPSPLNPEINVRIYAGPVTIKVQQNCKDFIDNGNTQHILADGKAFYIDGEARRQLFLNSSYYLYTLKATK
jgi:hypothetical protein